MGNVNKGQPVPPSRPAPDVPRTVTVAFAGGFDVGIVEDETFGPLQEAKFDVGGGSIIVRWPLNFGPKIAEAIVACHDEAGAATNGLVVPQRGIIVPPTHRPHTNSE